MLVVDLREGKKVTIGDTTLVVLAIEGTRVRIGVAAPPDVPVLRGEVAEDVRRYREARGR